MLASKSDVPATIQPDRPDGARIIDFSQWPRAGLKGDAASAWLQTRGVALPDVHRASRAGDGSLLARLGPNEYVALAAAPDAAHPGELPDFALGGNCEPGLCPVPRFAANSWFAVAGESSAALLAKICGVDLRPKRFADHAVAQTIVARISAVVVRDDVAGELRYHLLVDRTMATYFLEVLRDAMIEFGGIVALPP